MWGVVNAIQGGEACYFCKKTGHQKRDCRKYEEWKKKNPNRKTGSYNRMTISCYDCGKDGHISQECRGKMQNNRRKENGAVGGRQMTERGKSMAEMREMIKKLALYAGFPQRVPINCLREIFMD